VTKDYAGWKNHQTWSVASWILSDLIIPPKRESLYRAAVRFVREHPELPNPYISFIKHLGLSGKRTPEGYKWDSKDLDYQALDKMMKEL